MSGKRDAVVDAFYAAYNAHDAARAVALYTEDGAHREAATGQARRGREALEKGLTGFFSMLDDLHFEEMQRIRAGSDMLVVYVMRGRMTRDLGPMKARGQEIALPGAHLFAFDGDAIASTTDYWDPAEFGRQVNA